jgi:hypothetical protein
MCGRAHVGGGDVNVWAIIPAQHTRGVVGISETHRDRDAGGILIRSQVLTGSPDGSQTRTTRQSINTSCERRTHGHLLCRC